MNPDLEQKAAKEAKREKRNAAQRAWVQANPEKAKAIRDRCRQKHPEYLVRQREYKKRHAPTMRDYQRRWRAANPDRIREQSKRDLMRNRERVYRHVRAYRNRQTDQLADYYVRRKLSRNSPIHWRDWPQTLVDLKRAELKLKRLWQTPKASNTSTI